MKVILLTKGQFTMVDDEDFERLNQHKWYARSDRCGAWYAVRGRMPTIMMHKEILQTNQEVDHRNRNGLDNRKENLRLCTRSQNCGNRRKVEGSASKYKGVFRNGPRRWMVKIQRRYLGSFSTQEEAARAYNKAAQEAYGEFALLNEVK
jgi:HNH endonuclease